MKRINSLPKAKTAKVQIFNMDIEPYDQNVVIIRNGDFSDYYKYLKKQKSKGCFHSKKNLEYIEENKKEFSKDFVGNFLSVVLPCGYLLRFSDTYNWKETVRCLSHEILHLVHYVLRKVNIILTEESEEVFTYLFDNILYKILCKIYK